MRGSCTDAGLFESNALFGEGTVRREDYRNYFKGHMDQIKGEGGDGGERGFGCGGVEGWGEKAYNCN